MSDEAKTKTQLTAELAKLRRQEAIDQASRRILESVLAMRSSEDIHKVVVALWRAMVDLGIETPASSVWLINEGTGVYYHCNAFTNVERYGFSWPKTILVDDDALARPETGTLPGPDDPLYDLIVGCFSKQEPMTITWVETIEDLVASYSLVGHDVLKNPFLKSLEGEWTVTNCPFTHGLVGYRERQFVAEHVDVVRQLCQALSLGYYRFLDFQKLEEENRQLRIERVLDQIRAEVAMMKESQDLSRVVKRVEEGIRELQVQVDGSAINIMDEGIGVFRWLEYGKDWLEERKISLAQSGLNGILNHVYLRWKEGVLWHRQCHRSFVEELVRNTSADDVSSFAAELNIRGVDDADLRGKIFNWATTSWGLFNSWVVDVPFSHGTLAVDRKSGPFSDPELATLKRVTAVFEQAYLRHLDFRQMEEQATRLRRERAAEYIRAEALNMRSAADMCTVTAALWRQMRELGIKTPGCTVLLVDEDRGMTHQYDALENPRKHGLWWEESDSLIGIDEDTLVVYRRGVFREDGEDLPTNRPGQIENTLVVYRRGASHEDIGVLSTNRERRYQFGFIDKWKEGLVDKYEDCYTQEYGTTVLAGLGIQGDPWKTQAYQDWLGPMTVSNCPFTHGIVGFREPIHNEEHVQIVQELARALSVGYLRFLDFQKVDEAQRRLIQELEDELQTAHDLQMGLMPKSPPHIPGLDIAGQCIPANHVGGDFFHYFQQEGTLSLCLADVTGHAMEAAVPGLMFSGVLKSQVELGEPLDLLFQRLNRTLYATLDARTFVCFTMGQYDPATGVFRLADAGCPYPYHHRAATGTVEELRVEAYPLGVRPEGVYRVLQTTLAPGDRVVFCSDGVIEAVNAGGEMFGFERTVEVVRRGCQEGLSAEILLERIMQEVKGFRGEVAQGDDQTVVVLRVGDRPSGEGR